MKVRGSKTIRYRPSSNQKQCQLGISKRYFTNSLAPYGKPKSADYGIFLKTCRAFENPYVQFHAVATVKGALQPVGVRAYGQGDKQSVVIHCAA